MKSGRLQSQVIEPSKTNKDAERKERKRLYHRKILQNETSEQRAIRLQKQRVGRRRRYMAQRLNETPEQKKRQLFLRREYYRKKGECKNKRAYVKRGYRSSTLKEFTNF